VKPKACLRPDKEAPETSGQDRKTCDTDSRGMMVIQINRLSYFDL